MRLPRIINAAATTYDKDHPSVVEVAITYDGLKGRHVDVQRMDPVSALKLAALMTDAAANALRNNERQAAKS